MDEPFLFLFLWRCFLLRTKGVPPKTANLHIVLWRYSWPKFTRTGARKDEQWVQDSFGGGERSRHDFGNSGGAAIIGWADLKGMKEPEVFTPKSRKPDLKYPRPKAYTTSHDHLWPCNTRRLSLNEEL